LERCTVPAIEIDVPMQLDGILAESDALAYMQEVRALEVEIVKREAVLAARFAESGKKGVKKSGSGKR